MTRSLLPGASAVLEYGRPGSAEDLPAPGTFRRYRLGGLRRRLPPVKQ